MMNPNQEAGNSKISVAPKQVGKLALAQIRNSLYSKGGKTTLTGRFEAIPKNDWAANNKALIDSIANVRSTTYLESLKAKRK